MGLLNRIFSGPPTCTSPLEVPAAPSGRNKTVLSLPERACPEDHQAWRAQLRDTHELLAEIHELQSMNGAQDHEKLIQGGPQLPVHPDTLLEKAHLSGPKHLSARLHANRLPGGAIVMAVPSYAQRKLWQQDARENQVSHVVRIGTDNEIRKLDLCPGGPLSGEAATRGRQSRILSSHSYVSLLPGEAVPPSVLLSNFDWLFGRRPLPGYTVAFQSPGGDDRSAVFAAGWKVYKDLIAANEANVPLDDKRIQNAVRDAVLQMRMNRSTGLLTQPGHVASLLAMARQLTDRLNRYRSRHAPTVAPSPGAEEPSSPSPRVLTLEGAVQLAKARGICRKIAELHIDERPFAPLKGSRAAGGRIHQERMLKPDPRLTGLDGVPTRLQGAWAAPRTLVLERPGPDRSLAWAVACLTHNICAVVDVSDRTESAQPDAMANGPRSVGNDTEAVFAWGPAGRMPLEETAPGAFAIGMDVSARVKGQPVTRDLSQEPQYVDTRHPVPTQRPLELIHVPLAKDAPVQPKRLLEIAKMMQAHRADSSGDAIAVQCPAGDVRAAVVAAADLLYSRFKAGTLTEANSVETTQEIWTRLCQEYSIDLADKPEQVASLLALVELALAEDKQVAGWQS